MFDFLSRQWGNWSEVNWSRYVDRDLFFVLAVILGAGLVIMTSSSVAISENRYGNMYFFFNRQLTFMLLGLFLAFVVYQIRMGFWQSLGVRLLPVVLLLLVVVLIPGIGKEVNGSRRWIDLGLFSVQISEMAKLIMILYLSGYMVRHADKLANGEAYKPLLLPLAVLAVVSALLLLEPDFGTVVVIFSTGLALLFLSGVKIERLLLLFFTVLLVMGGVFMLASYRVKRLLAFTEPWEHSQGVGYQTVHALMAIGDGGWFGSGLGAGVQKLFYLPEAHNDFLFSVLAEEFGFVGIVVVLFFYGWLVQRAFVIGFNADKVKQHFGAYVAYGIGFWMGFQVLFHIGVNLALLPPKGLTLPLMSYGGSSLLTTLLAMALLMRVHRETQFALYGLPNSAKKSAKQAAGKLTTGNMGKVRRAG
jgi:cell division protein FtsW